MPEITFKKEITQEQYDVLQAVLKLWEKSLDEFIWGAIASDVRAYIESVDHAPLYQKSGFEEENEQDGEGKKNQ